MTTDAAPTVEEPNTPHQPCNPSTQRYGLMLDLVAHRSVFAIRRARRYLAAPVGA